MTGQPFTLLVDIPFKTGRADEFMALLNDVFEAMKVEETFVSATALRGAEDPDTILTLPKSLLSSFLNLLRHVSLLVLLHPTPVRCLNRSFESPFNIWYEFDFRGNSSHAFI